MAILLLLVLGYLLIGLIQMCKHNEIWVSWRRAHLLEKHNTLPRYFKYKESIITDVRNQHKCNSCWCFSLTSTFADTVAVKTGGKFRQHLSPQYLLSCTGGDAGTCQTGAAPEQFYDNPQVCEKGIPLESEYVYEGHDATCKSDLTGIRVCSVRGTSQNLCVDPAFVLPGFRSSVIANNIKNMKTALINYGPIVGTLRITKRLIQYDSRNGVYEDNSNDETLGSHAIEIIGYCESDTNTHEKGFQGAYWIVRNSYGNDWGFQNVKHHQHTHNHYFYVRMGNNNCDIESRASICKIKVPDEYKDIADNYDIRNSVYTSYEDYVDDSEKKQFIQELIE